MLRNNEIQRELEELSPKLASVSSENVYTVPDGYFENLSINLIPGLKDKKPNEVPDDYFENLPASIIDKIEQTPKIVSINKNKVLFKYAAAAVIFGLLGWSVYFLLDQKNTTDSLAMKEAQKIIKNNTFDQEISNINDEDMISYLEENGHDVKAALVASLSEDTELPSEVDFISNDNELEDYLQKKNIH